MLGGVAIATPAAVVAQWPCHLQDEMARYGGQEWPRHLASFRPGIHRFLAGDRAPIPALAAGFLPFQHAGTRRKVDMS